MSRSVNNMYASDNLSRELYLITEWGEEDRDFMFDWSTESSPVPKYSFGYLWDKLPASIKVELSKRVFYDDTDSWSVDLTAWYGDHFYWTEDFDSVEDALASLHLRLLKDKDLKVYD